MKRPPPILLPTECNENDEQLIGPLRFTRIPKAPTAYFYPRAIRIKKVEINNVVSTFKKITMDDFVGKKDSQLNCL